MKHLVYILPLILGLSFSLANSEAKTLYFAFDGNWLPYQHLDNSGFSQEVIKTIYEKQGYKVHFSSIPLVSSLNFIKTNRIDGIINLNIEEEKYINNKYVIPSSNYLFISEWTVVMRKESNNVLTSVEDLLKMGIWGFLRDYSYSTEFDKYILENKGDKTKMFEIVGTDNGERMMRMLRMKRFDFYFEEKGTAHYYAKKLNMLDKIRYKETTTLNYKEKIGVLFNNSDFNSQRIRKIFEKGMVELEKTNELKLLKNKYLID